MNILAGLTDEFLTEHFAPETLDRAQGYVDQVADVELSSLSQGSVTATALVPGTRPEPYQVQMHAEVGAAGGRGWLFTVCTCPVRSLCKHGAALALRLRRGFVGQSQDAPWQRTLARLAEELERQAPGAGGEIPLALEFSLDRRRGLGSGGRAVRLRPMRPGSRQPWVRTGADWPDIPHAVAARQHPADQGAAVAALQTLLQAHRPGGGAGLPPALEDFGPTAHRLLREAVAAGVTLLPGAGLTGVALAADPVTLVADVTAAEKGSAVELTLAVDDGERRWRGDAVLPLGHPATLVGLLADGTLTLAEAAAPIPPAARHLVEGDPITVPAGDLDDLQDRLRGLVRLLAVRSPDGAVPVPEPLRPVLVLTVSWHSSTHASLTWQWQYADGPAALRCDLRSTDTLGGVRDPAAEAAVLAGVPDRLRERTEILDGDALAFGLHDLPFLWDLDDVVVVEQERPDFREATGDPTISFDVVAPEPREDADGASAAETDWLDLAVVVRVEGEAVPLPDVIAALTLGREHLVLPSGLFITTDRPEFARLRDVVAAAAELREPDGDRIAVGRHDLGLWAELADTGVVASEAAEWVRRARALRDLVEIPRPEPSGLSTTLRSYQREGFWWLAFLWEHGLGGILADDMGLGKTLQVLSLIAHARERAPKDPPFLVVAPTSVVTAWAGEAARHAPHLRVAVAGRRTDDVAGLAADADVVVTTYTLLRLAEEEYAAVGWSALVLDEAQQVKNHQSKTYAAARAIDAPFRLAVTGTPFENRLMELWALLSITVPGLYPWPREFQNHVVRPIERAGDDGALDRFRRRIKPFLLRRTKELVAQDLPPKQEQVLEVDLSDRHRRVYDAHLAKERQRLLGLLDDFDRNRVAIFSALTNLRMLALDPALVDDEQEGVGSAKTEVLLEHLAEITAEGHRALVFSQFTSYLRRVQEGLADVGIRTAYLDGSTRDRGAVIDRFRNGDADVFLISLKAGGVGLTLTEADYVFVLDPWWNPAAEAQAVDRAHRIGQTNRVHVYRMVATDTVEEKVMELKARKAELFAQVIDGEGAMTTALSAEDIRSLFTD
ncbi:DEAD/DEAH box helicase [Nocardioides sp. GY 10113]|uniref:DEAD/DEAH box helicase n=1 Tax=Nocardioides sp. GY 10113 TaxID=2569761 RepID=UPI0010A7C65C|nr:DEAD/DEAH box helicase [Nocardioides sp. GY 10113]TIC88761.1 DEAD/DEAH box helicase [Nocardioides sp. GY 10113]